MKKRIISSLLLAAMLTSLVACGGDDTEKDNENKDNGDEAPAGIEAAEYNLPFNIYAPDFGMYQRYFFADDPGTDAMTKAIYEREVSVEDHLGVDIGYTLTGTIQDVRPKIQELVMTGDDTYHLFLTHCIAGLSAMITENLLYDFNKFEDINLDAEYWNQQAQDALEVNGHLFYGVSDYMLSDPNCILFNKGMIDELDLEDPYQLVRDGEWTIDKMMEMMASATKDDGNGRWNYLDTYGLTAPNDWYCNSFTFSSEVELVTRNSDGEFEFAFDNERSYTMVEKLDQLLAGNDTWIYDYGGGNNVEGNFENDEYVDISKGRSLFNIYNIAHLYILRDVDVDFGILPYPKLDASQDGYYTNDWSGLMCVPKTVQNTDMVGKVIELLSYYSGDTVKYAYYEIMLGEKLTRDPDSKEMLDIIFDGVSYNAGVNYFGFSDMNKLFYTPNALIMNGGGSGAFSSHLAKYQPASEAAIEQFNTDVLALDEAE
ncbi:MAG: hypothetical protein IJY93_08640 [Clostridia bacterium]|nr:hypothetical protein [Clostridia bacterium]